MEQFNITLLLVLATGLISYQGFGSSATINKALFSPYRIARDGSYYRFISSGFIHADWMHLIFNMIALYSIGGYVEAIMRGNFGNLVGSLLYILLYFSGIAVASLYDFVKHRDNPNFAALGASGAVSAVIFVLIFFAPWTRFTLFFALPIPAIVFGPLYLAYSWYADRNQIAQRIGHNAHFWGGLWGFLFIILVSLVLDPSLIRSFFGQLVAW